MNFDDLKDQLNESWQKLNAQIQESSLYNNLREKYEELPNPSQKAINFSGILLFAFILFMIPWNFLSSSNEYMESFEADRKMVRELFKASSLKNASTAPAVKGFMLKSRVQNTINSLNLVDEQKGAVEIEDAKKFSDKKTASLEKEALKVTLKKLNLTQVMNAGFALQNLSRNVKLAGLKINPTVENDHYFDATYSLVSYYVKPMPANEEPSTKKGKKRFSRKRGK